MAEAEEGLVTLQVTPKEIYILLRIAEENEAIHRGKKGTMRERAELLVKLYRASEDHPVPPRQRATPEPDSDEDDTDGFD